MRKGEDLKRTLIFVTKIVKKENLHEFWRNAMVLKGKLPPSRRHLSFNSF